MKNEELIERIEKLVGELEGLKKEYAEKLTAKQKEIDELRKEIDNLMRNFEEKRAEMEKVIPLIRESKEKIVGIDQIAAHAATVEQQSQKMEKQIDEARKLADIINGFKDIKGEVDSFQECFQDDKKRLERFEEKIAKFETREKNIGEELDQYARQIIDLREKYEGLMGVRFLISEKAKEEFLAYVLGNTKIIREGWLGQSDQPLKLVRK